MVVKLCSQILSDQIGKARFDAPIGWIVCLLQPSVMVSSPNVLTLPSSSEISLRTTHLKKEQAGIFVIIDVICGFCFFLPATNGET